VRLVGYLQRNVTVRFTAPVVFDSNICEIVICVK